MVQTFIIGATSRFSALRWTAPGISGPYLTTGVDGVNLNMWTKLNGQFEQQGNTNNSCTSMRWWSTSRPTWFSTPETFWRQERRRASASARTG